MGQKRAPRRLSCGRPNTPFKSALKAKSAWASSINCTTRVRWTYSRATSPPARNVLEIACGNRQTANWMAQQLAPLGGRVLATDYAAPQLEIARESAQAASLCARRRRPAPSPASRAPPASIAGWTCGATSARPTTRSSIWVVSSRRCSKGPASPGEAAHAAFQVKGPRRRPRNGRGCSAQLWSAAKNATY